MKVALCQSKSKLVSSAYKWLRILFEGLAMKLRRLPTRLNCIAPQYEAENFPNAICPLYKASPPAPRAGWS